MEIRTFCFCYHRKHVCLFKLSLRSRVWKYWLSRTNNPLATSMAEASFTFQGHKREKVGFVIRVGYEWNVPFIFLFCVKHLRNNTRLVAQKAIKIPFMFPACNTLGRSNTLFFYKNAIGIHWFFSGVKTFSSHYYTFPILINNFGNITLTKNVDQYIA